jgi:protease I
MAGELNGKRVAMLVADGFEQVELTGPKEALEKAGAKVSIVSPSSDKVQGWNHDERGDAFPVDVPLKSAKADEFDALVLPGGVMNPDTLRRNEWALQFVRASTNRASRWPPSATAPGR